VQKEVATRRADGKLKEPGSHCSLLNVVRKGGGRTSKGARGETEGKRQEN